MKITITETGAPKPFAAYHAIDEHTYDLDGGIIGCGDTPEEARYDLLQQMYEKGLIDDEPVEG